jgi:hypothetical protein
MALRATKATGGPWRDRLWRQKPTSLDGSSLLYMKPDQIVTS